jgi:hypothetical protein
VRQQQFRQRPGIKVFRRAFTFFTVLVAAVVVGEREIWPLLMLVVLVVAVAARLVMSKLLVARVFRVKETLGEAGSTVPIAAGAVAALVQLERLELPMSVAMVGRVSTSR